MISAGLLLPVTFVMSMDQAAMTAAEPGAPPQPPIGEKPPVGEKGPLARTGQLELRLT